MVALVLAILACWPAAASAQHIRPDRSRLYQYRDDHNIPAGRNVAVYEFEYPDKSRGTIAIDSERFTAPETRGDRIQGHSERRAAEILNSYGIKDSRQRGNAEMKRVVAEWKFRSNEFEETMRVPSCGASISAGSRPSGCGPAPTGARRSAI